jgi:hypothetical protein
MHGIAKLQQPQGHDTFPLRPRLAAVLESLPLGELAFTPVPVKARRDGWTVGRQIGFVHRLALCGCVATAARLVGMSRESAWRLRARPGAESFAAAWDRAAGWGADRLAELGLERCLMGEVRDVYYRGRKVGTRTCFDNRLLIAVLNRTPEPPNPVPPGEELLDYYRRALDALHELPPLETNDFLGDSA